MVEAEILDDAGRRWVATTVPVGVAGLGRVWEMVGEAGERAWMVQPLDGVAPGARMVGLGGPLVRLGGVGAPWLVQPARVAEDFDAAIPGPLLDAAGVAWVVEPAPLRVGGQARVHAATGPMGAVVVKISRRGGPGSALLREREALDALAASPEVSGRVCLPVGHGYVNGHAFVVYPRLDATLEEWSRTPQSLRSLLGALREATLAVVAFHRATVDPSQVRVHRDLKPSNFLVRQCGGVLLADLGAARSGEIGQRQTMTALHSAGFAPTDQLLGGARALDPGWDVFAMGVTLFVVLTGMFPSASLSAGADALSAAGAELSQLQRRAEAGHPLTPEEWRRRGELAALPADELVQADAQGWTGHDAAVLSGALQRHAPERDPAPLMAHLAPALAAALDLRPSRRATSAIALVLALDAAMALLPEDPLPAAPSPVPVAEVAAPAPVSSGRAPRMGRVVAGVIAVALIGVAVGVRTRPPIEAPGPGIRLVGCRPLDTVRVTLDGLPASVVGGSVDARPGQRLVIDAEVAGQRVRRSFLVKEGEPSICYELPTDAGCAPCP